MDKRIKVALVLFVSSLLLVLLRQNTLNSDDLSSDWLLNMVIEISDGEPGTVVTFSPPWDSERLWVVKQSIEHTGSRIIRARANPENPRSVQARITHAGKRTIDAEFLLRPIYEGNGLFNLGERLSDKQRALWLNHNPYDLPQTMQIWLQSLRSSSIVTYELIDAIISGAHRLSTNRPPDRKAYLHDVILMLRFSEIPARLVQGIELAEGRVSSFQTWVELYIDKKWQGFNPQPELATFEVPANWIALKKGEGELFTLSKGSGNLTTTIKKQHPALAIRPANHNMWSEIFDLDRLSVSLKEPIGLLLLLPLGALLNALLRTLVGINTYGIFSAPLLAVSMVFIGWTEGAIIFFTVLFIGLVGRSLLEEQRYVRFSRLTLVFILVALSMPIIFSALVYLGISVSEQVILLPIVILTTLIDRVYSFIDDYGVKRAMNRLFWTLLVSVFCFFIFIQEELAHLMLRYPELHLATMGVVVLLSLYQGRNLLEIIFNRSSEDKIAEKGSSDAD